MNKGDDMKTETKKARARLKRIALLFAADCCQRVNTIDLLHFARTEGSPVEDDREAVRLDIEFQKVIRSLFRKAGAEALNAEERLPNPAASKEFEALIGQLNLLPAVKKLGLLPEKDGGAR